jgi:hypothetical protein
MDNLIEKLHQTNEPTELNNNTNGQQWTVQCTHVTNREKQDTYDNISNTFIPTKLTLLNSEIPEEIQTKFVIPQL